MTGKFLFLSTLCLSALSAQAHDVHQTSDSISKQVSVYSEQYLQTLKPTYLKNVSEAANWGKNWFIEVKGGASAFLGSPIGCGDVFDRLTPALQVGVGKWFTPAVGGRVAFQGLNFKNAEFNSMKYQFIHADFMYNLTAFVRQNEIGLSRWDVIPFIGIGMVHNSDWQSSCMCPGHASGSHPFAFSYGLEARYRLCNRMHLIAELSGMTTAKNFDGIGTSSKFGDNMLTLSAGLSFTLGKVGYRRIIDANPYMAQNEWLLDYAGRLDRHNKMMSKQLTEDEQIMAEYHKILEIEGLLDLYGDKISSRSKGKEKSLFPKNDYSGLNSLRARMNNRGWDGNPEHMCREANALGVPAAMKKRGGEYDSNAVDALDSYFNGGDDDVSVYLSAIANGKEPIGSPIYFFFQIGTDNLTEVSQILNIDEIAKVAKAHHLKVKIIGAADSATGTDSINETLSRQRADYIKRLMLDRGISEEQIKCSHEGGIDDYSPVQANRNTCVILSFQ